MLSGTIVLTVPMDQRLDQLTAVQFVIVIGVVHLEVVELQLLLGHFAGVQRHFHVLGDVTGKCVIAKARQNVRKGEIESVLCVYKW